MAGVFLGEQVDRDTQGEQAWLGLGADTKLEVRHLGGGRLELVSTDQFIHERFYMCIYFVHLEWGEVGD